MRQKLSRFDTVDRVFDQLTELTPLLVSDRGAELLKFDELLAHKYDLSNVRNSSDPRIANQLWVEC